MKRRPIRILVVARHRMNSSLLSEYLDRHEGPRVVGRVGSTDTFVWQRRTPALTSSFSIISLSRGGNAFVEDAVPSTLPA
jgi:hypothetical protein